MLLLSAGGPAVRIVGRLDDDNEPTTARMQVADGFGPWRDFDPVDEDGPSAIRSPIIGGRRSDEATLIEYARRFDFD
jgi:hypothetical protein